MSEETTVLFAPPTIELVEHALREMGWDDSLEGYKMTASAGNAATHLYSLPAAILFLFGTKWDAPLLEPGNKGGINWLDVNELVKWLRDSVGDAELAAAIQERALAFPSYHEQVLAMRDIFTQRMDQYREVRAQAEPAKAAEEAPEAEAAE